MSKIMKQKGYFTLNVVKWKVEQNGTSTLQLWSDTVSKELLTDNSNTDILVFYCKKYSVL